jgi:hypothetical protein
MTTKGILVERIRRILAGGYPSDRDRIKDAEIALAIGPVANKLLKVEALNTSFVADGASTVEGSMIATYENIPVTRGYKLTAVAKLPATPIYMPEGLGVFSVYPSGRPDMEFIPVPAGIFNIWTKEALVNPISRRLYTWESGKVTIFDDLVGEGINTVDMKLCIVDINAAGDNDVLPVPPDMENDIISGVLLLLGVEPRTHRAESYQPSPEKGE